MAVETATSRAAVRDALRGILEGIDPSFAHVYFGEPNAIDVDRTCCYWVSGSRPTLEGQGIGGKSAEEHFKIAVFWGVPQNTDAMEALAMEKWDTIAAIEEAVTADQELGGLVERMDLIGSEGDLSVRLSNKVLRMVQTEIAYIVYDARGA